MSSSLFSSVASKAYDAITIPEAVGTERGAIVQRILRADRKVVRGPKVHIRLSTVTVRIQEDVRIRESAAPNPL